MSEVWGYQISCFLCLQLQLLCLVEVSMYLWEWGMHVAPKPLNPGGSMPFPIAGEIRCHI